MPRSPSTSDRWDRLAATPDLALVATQPLHRGFSGWGFVILAIALAAIIVPSMVMGRRRRKRRQVGPSSELDAFVADTGWRRMEPDPGLFRDLRGVPFENAVRPEAADVLRGAVRGHDAVAFDYSVDLPAGRAHYQVCRLTLPASLPVLDVEPNSAARLETTARTEAISTGDDAFDRRFTAYSPDQTFARAILSPTLTARLRATSDCAWRIDGDGLVAVAPEPLSAVWLRETAAMLATIAGAIPEDVWPGRAGDAPAAPGWTPPASAG